MGNFTVKIFLFILTIFCFSPPNIKSQDSLAQLYFENANVLFDNEKYTEAALDFRRAIDRKKLIGNNILHVDYIALALTYLERGETDSASLLMDTAVYYKNLLATDTIITSIENNLARIYMNKGEFDKALEHYIIALENASKENDTLNQIFINSNIGTLYQRMMKKEMAVKYYLEAYRFSKLSNNDEGMAMAYSIGIFYARSGEYDTAMDYYRSSIPYCKKLGKINDLINIYSNMSNVYMLKGRYDEAVKILHKSISLSKSNDRNRQLGIAYANMGKAKELSGENDSSIYYLKNSIAIVSKLGTLNLLSQIYELMSEAYESDNNYKNSLLFYRKYKQLSDSILNERIMSKIANLETKYETEKTEKENILLKSDIKLQKRQSYYLQILTIILFLLGIISLALFYFIRKNEINKKKLAESEAKILETKVDSQKRELTLTALSLTRNIEFINSLIIELKDISTYVTENGIPILNNIVKKFARQQSNSVWKEFEKRFSDVHSDFYSLLLEKYPHLTQNDLKLSAFLKLGMNTKEICTITFQSVRAVEAGRLRLRKKLNLSKNDNLNLFLQTL